MILIILIFNLAYFGSIYPSFSFLSNSSSSLFQFNPHLPSPLPLFSSLLYPIISSSAILPIIAPPLLFSILSSHLISSPLFFSVLSFHLLLLSSLLLFCHLLYYLLSSHIFFPIISSPLLFSFYPLISSPHLLLSILSSSHFFSSFLFSTLS